MQDTGVRGVTGEWEELKVMGQDRSRTERKTGSQRRKRVLRREEGSGVQAERTDDRPQSLVKAPSPQLKDGEPLAPLC